MSHLSLVSCLFSLHHSSFNNYLSSSESGPSQVGPPLSMGNSPHSEKVWPSSGSRPGGSPNSLGNNEHSAKALYFLSCSFMFFHVLSCSFIVFFLLFFLFFFFSRVLKILLFLPRLSHDFLLKLVCKNQMFGPTQEVPHWALFFLSCLFFSFSFSFSFSF